MCLFSLEKLAEGVEQSCCILLLLNDETLTSKWCEYEVQHAHSLDIPIICLLDIDRQPARPVIDALIEQDYGWLFDRQVISCECCSVIAVVPLCVNISDVLQILPRVAITATHSSQRQSSRQ